MQFINRERIAYALVKRILRWGVDGNLLAHAERELGPVKGKDGPDLWMHYHMLAMVRLFCLEGHSGMSASIARGWLSKLLDFKPLGPLTGDDSEWTKDHVLDADCRQNMRCSQVFLDESTSLAFDVDGFVFQEPDGGRFTSRESSRIARFPYHPKRLVVNVPKDPTIEQRIDAIRSAGVPDSDIWCLAGAA